MIAKLHGESAEGVFCLQVVSSDGSNPDGKQNGQTEVNSNDESEPAIGHRRPCHIY